MSVLFTLAVFNLLAQPSPADSQIIAAVRAKNITKVQDLLRAGASPNAREILYKKPSLRDNEVGGSTYFGDSALAIAVRSDNLLAADALLKAGAKVNGKNQYGYTPLMSVRSVKLANLLLQHHADLNVENETRSTALTFALSNGDMNLVKLLIGHGANVNKGDALAYAVEAELNEMLPILLDHGANPNVRGPSGLSAFEIATRKGDYGMIRLLKKHGGKGRSVRDIETITTRAEAELEKSFKSDDMQSTKNSLLQKEDTEVLTAVAKYILQDPTFRRGDTMRRSVKVSPKLLGGYGALEDDQVNSELPDEKALSISLEMRRSMRDRGRGGVMISHLSETIARVSLESEPKDRRDRRIDWDSVYITPFLPGYSVDKQHAFARFLFRPSAHGTSGTALLAKEQDGWRVVWIEYVHYA